MITLKCSENPSCYCSRLSEKHIEALKAVGWVRDADWDTLMYAAIQTENIRETLLQFEALTGREVTDEGCYCCGAPHSFSWDDEEGRHCVSGEDLLPILYPDIDCASLRDAFELLSRKGD